MRLSILLLLSACLMPAASFALPDFMPTDQNYDAAIPTPESVLGFEVGEWHVRHDQLVRYMEVLSEASPRFSLQMTGRTHEQRPLLLVTVTAEANQSDLETLRQQHLEHAWNGAAQPGPLVLWFGYSIHGNEASGSNAALLMAYHLAASQDPQLLARLESTVILIDPSLNPDGLGRFAHWANTNRSKNLIGDRNNREHNEEWPGGRFNHYWFDLNRDWLLLTHPESRARVSVLRQWQPNVITDFHEMGSDSTYFFQPGVPERQNPLTPDENFQLTARLATYHGRAFDQIGQLYFSKEQFDDFYYGKGSTYPDIQGMVGILFEQASARGHLMDTDNGPLSFETAVRNHFTTSISTLDGATDLAAELKAYQQRFFRQVADEARQAQSYLFGDRHDPGRTRPMADILIQHGIEVHELSDEHRQDGIEFSPGSAFVVPGDQRQQRLVEAVFERRTSFKDSTFYDVSAWTFPLAFDLPAVAVRKPKSLAGDAYTGAPVPAAVPEPGAYAYAFEWTHYSAARSLQRLLDAGLRPRVATDELVASTTHGERRFSRGTIVIPVGSQTDPGALMPILERIASEDGVPVLSITTGLSRSGSDLGSPSLRPLEPIRPLLITGAGVSATEAGEVWHLMDTRIGLAPVMVEKSRLERVDLSDYTHVLMVDGGGDLDPVQTDRLKQWVQHGGVLVTTRDAAAWATTAMIKAKDDGDAPIDPQEVPPKEDQQSPQKTNERRAYGDFDDDYSKTVIGGAIVRGDVDITHPMAYGYTRSEMPLFRRGTTALEPSENPYETVIRYAQQPLIAGFLGDERRQQLAGSGALIASKFGRGAVIRMADNPNFRGVWYGTNRLYFNALFLAQILESTELPDTDSRL
jgi:hypothetical protein